MKLLRRIHNSNAIWAIIAVLVNCAINFTVVPYVTERVGVEAYGYVSLSNTIITYVDVISVALNSFAGRFIALTYHKNEFKKANIYYASSFYANLFLCVILSIVAAFGIRDVQKFLNISATLETDVRILFFFVLARYNFVLLRTVFDTACFIKNRLDITEKFRALSYIIQAVLLIILCGTLRPKIWYIGIASMSAAFVLLISQMWCAHKFTPELKIKINLFSIPSILEIISTGVWTAINNLGNILNSGLDLLIANKMLLGVTAGNISVSKSVGSMCYTLISSVSNSFRPRQLEKYSKGDLHGLVLDLKLSMRINGMLCGVIIAGFLVCGMDFLHLWIPTQDNASIFDFTMIVLIGDIIIGVVNPLYYVFTLTKKVKVPCYITLLMGAANVISMIILIHMTSLGGYVVVLTTMFINFIHFIDTPVYAAYCLKLPLTTFFPEIFRHLLNAGILVAVMFVMNSLPIEVNGWVLLLLKIILYGITGIIISFLVMTTQEEKSYVLRRLKKYTRG